MSSIRLHPEHGLNPTIPVCVVCGEKKNEVALLGASYKGQAPMHMIVDKVPCEPCQHKMSLGVLLISVKDGESGSNPYRTGKMAVIKEEAAHKAFPNLKGRVAFIDDTTWSQIGLPE